MSEKEGCSLIVKSFQIIFNRIFIFFLYILSVNINKLVNEGFLERLSVEGDRRKVRLVCTEKAGPIIERARKAHESFHRLISEGLTEADFEACQHCLAIVSKNAERIKRMNTADELRGGLA
ncbi:MAG: hypothetical protein NC541_02080 [bacterium]|nr:hypothetical protein [bacterium]